MKRIPLPLAVLLFVAAFVFAYFRYVDTFRVRRLSGNNGPPGMPAAAIKFMAEHPPKANDHKDDKNKKLQDSEKDKSAAAHVPGKSSAATKKEGD